MTQFDDRHFGQPQLARGSQTTVAGNDALAPIHQDGVGPAEFADACGDLGDLRWGMTAVANLNRGALDAFQVPLTALYSKDGKSNVWIVDETSQTVRLQPVRSDGLNDEYVRVIEGLKPGDRVVTAGANLLVAGQRIKLTDPAK